MNLYHYTSLSGYNGINSDRYIKASSPQNAKFGPGVYLTAIEPNEDRKITATGIFCNGGETRYKQGGVDHFIHVVIPEDDNRLIPVKGRSQVYRFCAELLQLDEFEWDSGRNSTWKTTLTGLALVGGLVLGGLALAFGQNKSEEEKDSHMNKATCMRSDGKSILTSNRCAETLLNEILDKFQRNYKDKTESKHLSVFSPDCCGEVSIWCTRCFRRACWGYKIDCQPSEIREEAITHCLQDHLEEEYHLVDVPGTSAHAKFRKFVSNKYGKENEEAYFKLDRFINSYQNLNRKKKWIHRLRVESSGSGIYVLCSRCDLMASSIYKVKKESGALFCIETGTPMNEEHVHQGIDEHFKRDLFRMHYL